MLLQYPGMDSCLSLLGFTDASSASRFVHCFVSRETYADHNIVVEFQNPVALLSPAPVSHLDLLVVTADSITIGKEISTTDCLSIDHYELDGISYSLASSRWQSREDEDSQWSYVEDSWRIGEVCVAEPMEDGMYRLLVLINHAQGSLSFFSNTIQLSAPEPQIPRSERLFQDNVYAPIVQSRCAVCHIANGVASRTRLRFVHQNTTDDRTKNLEVIRDFFDVVTNARTLLLNKATNRVRHGGGVQVPDGSDLYQKFDEFLQAVEDEQEG